MLSQMSAIPPFCGWIIFQGIFTVIFHCVLHLHYPFTHRRAFRLFPCLCYCRECCDAPGSADISLERWLLFLWIQSQEWLLDHISSICNFWGTAPLLSIRAVLIYIPTNSVLSLVLLIGACTAYYTTLIKFWVTWGRRTTLWPKTETKQDKPREVFSSSVLSEPKSLREPQGSGLYNVTSLWEPDRNSRYRQNTGNVLWAFASFLEGEGNYWMGLLSHGSNLWQRGLVVHPAPILPFDLSNRAHFIQGNNPLCETHWTD